MLSLIMQTNIRLINQTDTTSGWLRDPTSLFTWNAELTWWLMKSLMSLHDFTLCSLQNEDIHRVCTLIRPQFLRYLWRGNAGFLTLPAELGAFCEVKKAVSGGTLLMSLFRFAAGSSSVSSSSLQSSQVKRHYFHVCLVLAQVVQLMVSLVA